MNTTTAYPSTAADKTHEALRLADGAYSQDNYGNGEWERLAAALVEAGYDHRETAAIMMSKYTRWAADAAGAAHGTATAADFLAWRAKSPREFKAYEIKALVAGTF